MRLENPVLSRELVENLRSPRAFMLQAIFVAALGSVVLVAWPPEGRLGLSAEISMRIYETFALGQLVLIALVAPILSAPAIASEQERKSLDLLLTSPLKPSAIAWGKLLSSVVYLLLLAISSLPIFSCCFFLGSVAYREILATYIILMSTGFLCGTIGITASAYMGRVRGALTVSYVIIIPATLLIVLANPISKLHLSLFISMIAVGIGILMMVIVQQRLKKPFDIAPKAADEENSDEQIGLVLNRNKFPDRLLSPKGSGLPMDERKNPIYQKELFHELFGRGTLLVRLLLQISLIAALPFFIASLAMRGLWVYSYYMLVFVMLIAPSLTAGVFTQERERGTFDLLLTTGLTKAQILRGKLLVNIRNISILIGFLLPLLFLFIVIATYTDLMEKSLGKDHYFAYSAGTIAILLSTSLFVVLLTCFFSMICRTTLRSMVMTYATIGVLFILPLVAYMVMTQLAQMPMNEATWIGTTSPFYTLASYEYYYGHAGMSFLPLPSGVALMHSSLFLSTMLGGSLLLLLGMNWMFRRCCQLRHDYGL